MVEFNLSILLAGHAEFSLHNERTNKHLTFKVKKPNKRMRPFFYHVFVQQAHHWVMIGNVYTTRFVAGNYVPVNDIRLRAFEWLYYKLSKHIGIPEGVRVQLAERCYVCGRKLTDPESIKRGTGPECAKERARLNERIAKSNYVNVNALPGARPAPVQPVKRRSVADLIAHAKWGGFEPVLSPTGKSIAQRKCTKCSGPALLFASIHNSMRIEVCTKCTPDRLF
jgi:hypothetical protein